MGVLLVPLILQLVVSLSLVGSASTVQRSKGHNISPSPASFSSIPPLEGPPGPIQVGKPIIGNPPSSVVQTNGSDLLSPATLPPLISTPMPRTEKGLEPSLSPGTPINVSPSHNLVPPLIDEGHSLPPSTTVTPPLHATPPNVQGHEPSLAPSSPILFPPPRDITPAPSIVRGHEEIPPPTFATVSPTLHDLTPPPSVAHGNIPSSHSPNVSPPYRAAPPPLNSGGDVSPPPTSAMHHLTPPPVSTKGHIPSVSPSVPTTKSPSHNIASSPIVKGHTPLLSPPSTTVLTPAYDTAPPPLNVQAREPSIAPSIAVIFPSPHDVSPSPSVQVHKELLSPAAAANETALAPSIGEGNAPLSSPHVPSMKEGGHVSPPTAPAPTSFSPAPVVSPPSHSVTVTIPSSLSPQIAPAIPPSMSVTLPPRAHSPDNNSSIVKHNAPVVSPPKYSGQTPEAAQPVMAKLNSPVSSAPVAPPVSELPQNTSASPPVMPGESPSIILDPRVSPTSSPPPSIDFDKPGIPAATPPIETSKPPSPAKDSHVFSASAPPPSIDLKNHGTPVATPTTETPKPASPFNHSPATAPSMHQTRKHFEDVPLPSPSMSPPNEGHHAPKSSPSTSAAPLPSHSKHGGHSSPESSPLAPTDRAVRHDYDAPFSSPLWSPPASSPSTSKYTGSPSPTSSYMVSPPASEPQGPVISHGNFRKSRQTHYAPSPFNPVSSPSPSYLPHPASGSHISPVPSPSPTAASGHSEMSDLAPKISPSGLLSKSPKMPPHPLIQALPPPPPNQDCAGTICNDPYTNTPPGAPCDCVLPMQVGLLLGVELYTFFPLVSELAQEIAVGVFMKQSQVRIMGANAASQQPQKTVVLIDLVPLGSNFDNATAFLSYQRFWHKQVEIKASYFSDYEVLYVRYPGLPASPPLPPSSRQFGNAGRAAKPIGVKVPQKQHKKGISGGMVAVIVLSAAVTLILGSAGAWLLLFKGRDQACLPTPASQPSRSSLAKPSGTAGSLTGSALSSASLSFGSSIPAYTGSAKTFSSSELEKATDKFNASRILGEGGFGRVYSGVLEDGTEVAVKVLKRDDQQGGREFLAEVEMLSRLHHRNLVKLIGICTEEHARCLVYELIPNGSVESHLHGVDKEFAPLDWDSRIKIALGSARGLAYLHEDSSPRVIHRDFKASNILLEQDFTPKVSDFGLARAAMDEESRHISTRVMGTFGYVAPEYAMTGHLLVKSDVYSYGVVLLELLTGRKPVDMSRQPGQENLVAWANPYLTSKEGLETIIDPSLGHDVPFDSVAKVAAIASMCVQPEVSHRPFMGEVVQALKLVCNECDEAKEVASRSSCQDDCSIDMDARVSSSSGQLPDPLQSQFPGPHYDPILDPEKGLSVSDLFEASTRLERQESGSFRRYSSSGPLGRGRSKELWQKLRRFSGGSLSEHKFMFKLQPGSQ